MGATAASGGYSAYSQYQQGKAENKYYNSLASQREQEGRIALEQGDQQSKAIQDTASFEGKELKKDQARFSASQRAAMAAAGIAGVTAEDIGLDTLSKQQQDEFALRYNADLNSYEAKTQAKYKDYALRTEAGQLRYQGAVAKASGKKQAFGTLLSTASSVASMGAKIK